ncbi:MAG: TaqI-like C-terminal specificity domain-containing protein [Candidatus Micrarchaeia archaeon]
MNRIGIYDSIRNIRKSYGIFFTPQWVVDFMVQMINKNILQKKDVLILEPACGNMQFLIGIKRNNFSFFKKAKKFALEINEKIVEFIKHQGMTEGVNIINSDYLLWKNPLLFDLIIGNPPYGIPSLSEHYTIKVDDDTKRKYKEVFTTWYGKYNVYGAFIEKSIQILKKDGQLIFIIPATFMILDEFKKLRKYLAMNGETTLIYMGQDVFSPEANVSTVVLNFVKSNSLSQRLTLFEYNGGKINLVCKYDKWNGELVLFETPFSKRLNELCSYRLGDVYDIKISPRTPEIKHNPFIVKSYEKLNGYLPILNGKNLKCKEIIYEHITGYWIPKDKVTTLRKFFDTPHLVVGLGFRKNGRIAVAYDRYCYPWMGDVYHLIRKDLLFSESNLGEDDIVEYLSSNIIKQYVRDVYKQITYHLSITQLKILPLPTRNEWKKIKKELL